MTEVLGAQMGDEGICEYMAVHLRLMHPDAEALTRDDPVEADT
jgi:hypothetical protein